jgi:class 3 adenylate cyclase
MFSDLKGFPAYSAEHSAEVVITEFNKYLADMETALLQYNVHIDKYMADGIVSEFAAPIRHEKHPLLAAACA